MRRRQFLKVLGISAIATSPRINAAPLASPDEVSSRRSPTHQVEAGHRCQILLRWGDPLTSTGTPWHPGITSPTDYAGRFGYNNDFLAYWPLQPLIGERNRGVLCVNHEFTNPQLMWTGCLTTPEMDRSRTEVEGAVLGHSVVEIAQDGREGGWRYEPCSRFNRRFTIDSRVDFTGPAAGHRRLWTALVGDGKFAHGMLGLCGGGKTPWGTVLVGEENFQTFFNDQVTTDAEARNHQRYGVGAECYSPWWARHFDRFDIAKAPREPNHFGWVVEIDPLRPDSTPKKHTALGRFRHEAATCIVSADGRLVVYSGDDAAFEYLYKYVSADAYRADAGTANSKLLEEGTLHVARFANDGSLVWLPLAFGAGPLTPKNGFNDQGDVLIEARRAADLLQATKLDRPEDVETDPISNVIYTLLTNNPARTSDTLDAANPRPENRFGHVLQLLPPGAPGPKAQHSAPEFRWRIFLLGGNPENPLHHAQYPGEVSKDGWLAAPDNCAFGPQGGLWLTSDSGALGAALNRADGLWRCRRTETGHGSPRRFFSAPLGSEVCGPEFTPDGRTLFLAIQHPGDTLNSCFETPSTRWPDFDPALPPRPAIIAITRDDGGAIGG
ncbi:MAG: PhoX family phosphatase [Gammaproteobacteria bacterium]|nr:PhoX family phosphatase [Gammaproteobacteria bacterium]